MSDTARQCYHFGCQNDGDTADHLPPKVFFPEEKDVGFNYRNPLFTLPACKGHNKSFELDDEYVAYVMHSHYKISEPAIKNFRTKILRALKRSKRLHHLLFSDLRHVWMKMPDSGKLRRTGAFTVDTARVNRVMCRIASGLYFKVTGEKTSADPAYYFVYTPDTFFPDSLKSNNPESIENYISANGRFTPLNLWNSDIFSCDYHINPVEKHEYLFRFTFYGGFRYRVVSLKTIAR